MDTDWNIWGLWARLTPFVGEPGGWSQRPELLRSRGDTEG